MEVRNVRGALIEYKLPLTIATGIIWKLSASDNEHGYPLTGK